MLAKFWATLTEINWTVFKTFYIICTNKKVSLKGIILQLKFVPVWKMKISFIMVLYVEFWTTLLQHSELA